MNQMSSSNLVLASNSEWKTDTKTTFTNQSPPSSSPKVQKHTEFFQTIHSIAQSEGYDPIQIASLFEAYSSTDFVCGPPLHRNDQIPARIWQRVCDHFNAAKYRPYRLSPIPNPKSMVFISGKVTERLVQSELIHQRFSTAQRLYQYLNWTMKMNQMSQTMIAMEGKNGRKVLLFDVELHDLRGRGLYALCTPKSDNWQLVDLLTTQQLTNLLGIDLQALPRGVRAVSPQFEEYRMNIKSSRNTMKSNLKELKTQILSQDSRSKPVRYVQLKCVRTKSKKHKNARADTERVLNVGLSSFYAKVRRALIDDHIDLIPIVSVVAPSSRSKKSKRHIHRGSRNGSNEPSPFTVDYLLPVRIGTNWVGVVYRDGVPVQGLTDCYDIINKAVLCDPSFNVESLRWFKNSYDRLRVVSDEILAEREDMKIEEMEELKMEELPSNESNQMTPSGPSGQSTPRLTLDRISSTTSATSTTTTSSMGSMSPILSSSRSIRTPTYSPSSLSINLTASPVSSISTPLSVMTPQDIGQHVVVLPVDMMLQWTKQLMFHGMRNKEYFGQFLSNKTRAAPRFTARENI